MDERQLEQKLSSLLPQRAPTAVPGKKGLGTAIKGEARAIAAKADAKELARLKYNEKQKLAYAEKKHARLQAEAERLGLKEVPKGANAKSLARIAEQQKRVELLEAVEAQTAEPLSPDRITLLHGNDLSTTSSRSLAENISTAQAITAATTRPEVLRLLSSLNINLNVQLSKSDTANLLACLLTCNEAQLDALITNPKVPVVIKTVIKRLKEDMRLGNMDAIEKLWDRVFGKGAMALGTTDTHTEAGIIPNTPVSREAYIVIRDTLIK